MQELSVQVVGFIESFKVLGVVLVLAEGESLLEVHLGVVFAHVIHDCDFRRDLTLCGPALSQEGPDVRLVQVCVVVGVVLLPIYVEEGRVVEVVVE